MAYILLKVMCKFVLSVSYSEKQMPWGRDSHYKRLRMPPSDSLIIRILASLLALGCSRQNAAIYSGQGIFYCCTLRND